LDSEETLSLPGLPDQDDDDAEEAQEEEGQGQEEEEEEEDGESGDGHPKGEDTNQEPNKDDNLRAKYWEVVHAAQKEIKRKNPEMSNREVLKRARASCLDNISFTHRHRKIRQLDYLIMINSDKSIRSRKSYEVNPENSLIKLIQKTFRRKEKCSLSRQLVQFRLFTLCYP